MSTTVPSSLRAFLTHTKSQFRLRASKGERLTFVIGNESSGTPNLDLDSLSCTILYAYLRSRDSPKHAFASPPYIPLLNIPAADIAIRPEFRTLFRHADIDEKSLLTLDDILPTLPRSESSAPHHSPSTSSSFSPPSSSRQQAEASQASSIDPSQTSWILVDHNKLQGELGKHFGAHVHGVIDHHDDEGTVRKDTEPEPRVVEKCGSCTSLVVRYLKESWLALAEEEKPMTAKEEERPDSETVTTKTGQSRDLEDSIASTKHQIASQSDNPSASRSLPWQYSLAKVALAAILIDTSNLQSTDKTCPADVDAVSFLHERIAAAATAADKSQPGIEAAAYDRDNFFDELSAAKGDITSLPLCDALRKDYKMWEEEEGSGGVGKEGGEKVVLKVGVSSVVASLATLRGMALRDRDRDRDQGQDGTGGSASRNEATTTEATEESSKGGKDEESWKDFSRAVTSFQRSRRLDVFAIMTTFTNERSGDFTRELLLQTLSPRMRGFVSVFENDIGTGEKLGLEKVTSGIANKGPANGDGNDGNGNDTNNEVVMERAVWRQKNVGISRKGVAPLLREALRKVARDS
ncbi:Exopolyphosphatase [Agyrium rufum]|nr:Exopolyphosphatase [Agyrium rufum]